LFKILERKRSKAPLVAVPVIQFEADEDENQKDTSDGGLIVFSTFVSCYIKQHSLG